MNPPKTFSPEERALQKQVSREKDRIALASGNVSVEALRRENGLFFGRVPFALRGDRVPR